MITNDVRTLAFSLLATLLVVAVVAGTAFNQQQVYALNKFHRTNSSPYPQDAVNRFALYSNPIFLWHYDYSKSERANIQAFIVWYCAPNKIGQTPSQCYYIQSNSDPISAARQMMRYVAVYGDTYASNEAVARVENKPYHDDFIRAYIGLNVNSTNPVGLAIDDKAWPIFLKYEQAAFHFDYRKADHTNLKAFEQYNSWMKLSDQLQERWMWYNEQVRDARLYDIAVAYANGHKAPVYFLPNAPTAPEKITPAIVNSWISEGGKKYDYLFKV